MAKLKSVFLSSTGKDLADYREAAYRTISAMDGYHCVRMEDFGARDALADDFCRQKVAECDVFVGILGHCFGSCPKGSSKSYTEQEYDAAVAAGKPRLMFLAPEDFPLPSSLIESDEERAKQRAFRDRVSSERIRDTFASPDDLARRVVAALHNLGPDARDRAGLLMPLPPQPYFAHPYPLQSNFTGRVREREMLTQWLTKDNRPVFALVAIGGMGKSALTWVWVNRDVLGLPLIGQAEDPPDVARRCRVGGTGAGGGGIGGTGVPPVDSTGKMPVPPDVLLDGVLWWSFYESQASFDSFVRTAVAYASGGEVDPASIPSTYDGCQMLLTLLGRKRILLVLDGLERILNAYTRLDAPYQGDEVKEDPEQKFRACTDPHAAAFLKALCSTPHASRILITSRLFPRDLDYLMGCCRCDLHEFDPDGTIAGYAVLRLLRSHGSGNVYLAEDRSAGNRRVAVKSVCPSAGLTREKHVKLLRDLFLQVAALAQIRSPNVQTIHHVVQKGATLYIVMEHVEGESLSDVLDRGQGIPQHEALRIALGVLSALAAAHARGIPHRDVRPANIMLESDGEVKLVYFGLALPGAPSVPAGYMAPEQIAGGPCSEASDLFSLGVILYEILVGRRPFLGDTSGEVAFSTLYEAPVDIRDVDPSISAGLARAVMRALAKAPGERFASATEMSDFLSQTLDAADSGVRASPPRRREVRRYAKAPLSGGKGIDEGPDRWGGDDSGVGELFRGCHLSEVLFGAAAPRRVAPGAAFVAHFTAYTTEFRQHIENALRAEAPSVEPRRDLAKCRWQVGTKVLVCLSSPQLKVLTAKRAFTWDGRWEILRFDVRVPDDSPAASAILAFDVVVDGFVVQAIRPEVEVVSAAADRGHMSTTGVPAPRTAFASYSRRDRARVMERVRSLQIHTGMDVFLDCLSIHPGEPWKQTVAAEIRKREVFWLFWSRSAMRSMWVEWEWRTALRERALPAIRPHPLEPADIAPPPPELSELQFGGAYEYYLMALRSSWLRLAWRRLRDAVLRVGLRMRRRLSGGPTSV